MYQHLFSPGTTLTYVQDHFRVGVFDPQTFTLITCFQFDRVAYLWQPPFSLAPITPLGIDLDIGLGEYNSDHVQEDAAYLATQVLSLQMLVSTLGALSSLVATSGCPDWAPKIEFNVREA